MMLTRQKILLTMLAAAERPVNRMELTKWAFLLRQEAGNSAGAAHYDFLPYHFGPFSFSLYQEIGKLEEQGYVQSAGETHWSSGPVAATVSLDKTQKAKAEQLVRRYRRMELDDLLDQVYEAHPQYTVNSRRRKLQQRPTATLAIYTSGYEGLSVDAFLNRLIETGIRHLVDVRRNPIARRFGFHKSTLQRLCESLDIQYSHIPELGIASGERQELHTQADRDKLFERYSATTLNQQLEVIAHVADLVQTLPTVLVCMEAQPCACHRSHLAMRIEARTGLEIRHLMQVQRAED